MILTVLVDNNTYIDRYFLAEPGLSFHLQVNGVQVLFDAGYSDVCIRNAPKLGLDLRTLDHVVLSHAHMDHTGGLVPLAQFLGETTLETGRDVKPTLTAHPDVFLPRATASLGEIGSPLSEEKAGRFFNLNLSRTPVWLTERLVFLGEIPRGYSFEGLKPLGRIIRAEAAEDDYSPDDSALVYRSSRGLVVITGCSHAGICNLIDYARTVCGEDRVLDIVGGLHLLDPPPDQLQGTADYLRALRPEALHACHCTDFRSKQVLADVVNVLEVGVGLRLEYPD